MQFDLGLVDFKQSLDFQKDIFSKVKANQIQGGLILCRHYPVFTCGRNANKKNILISETELRKRNIPVYEIERGGDVTYHGPGQLTVYPVFNLNYLKKDIRWFLRRLEDVTVNCLVNLGIGAQTRAGLTGVWVKDKKIASIGIAIRNWITFHGVSMNIKQDDLENFRLIRPCGMDIEMTSVESELGRDIEVEDLKESMIHNFAKIGGLKND